MSSLFPQTEAVWQVLGSSPALAGFVLIGGTALALRIEHRRSEDLDLAWTGPRLPRERIRLALDEAARSGFAWERHDDPAAIAEFEDTGLELHDFLEDFLVGGVKVTFFTLDAQAAKVISNSPEVRQVRVATLEEIFATKCLVTASRSRTRDWFDLWTLMTRHGFSLTDYLAVFDKVGSKISGEIGLARLCSGHPERADEGFAALVEGSPSVAELRDFFRTQRDEYEVAEARRRLPPE